MKMKKTVKIDKIMRERERERFIKSDGNSCGPGPHLSHNSQFTILLNKILNLKYVTLDMIFPLEFVMETNIAFFTSDVIGLMVICFFV